MCETFSSPAYVFSAPIPGAISVADLWQKVKEIVVLQGFHARFGPETSEKMGFWAFGAGFGAEKKCRSEGGDVGFLLRNGGDTQGINCHVPINRDSQ